MYKKEATIYVLSISALLKQDREKHILRIVKQQVKKKYFLHIPFIRINDYKTILLILDF